MDLQTILEIGIAMDITIFILPSMALIILVWVHRAKHATKPVRVHKTKPVHARATYSSHPIPQHAKRDIFPNGYSRQEYHAYGADDSAISYFGLDQPNAPGPPLQVLC